MMSTLAMSSAKLGLLQAVSCLHVSGLQEVQFHRAKPVSEKAAGF